MPRIFVKIYTTLKDRTGTGSMVLEGETVAEVLLAIRQSISLETADILFDTNGIVRNHFVMVLNSLILDHGKVNELKVKDGDILHLFPPVSGG
jgi:molybdopterin converting factor small subunit